MHGRLCDILLWVWLDGMGVNGMVWVWLDGMALGQNPNMTQFYMCIEWTWCAPAKPPFSWYPTSVKFFPCFKKLYLSSDSLSPDVQLIEHFLLALIL